MYWQSAADAYEPDDDYGQAKTLSGVQTHSIKPTTDVDWLMFSLSESSEVILETQGPSGYDTRMWLYDSGLNQVEYSDDEGVDAYSYIDRRCDADPLPAGTYYVKVDEYGNNAEIPSYNIAFSTYTCASLDTTPPTVDWVSPVGDEGVYHCRNEIVPLQVDAEDNVGVARALPALGRTQQRLCAPVR